MLHLKSLDYSLNRSQEHIFQWYQCEIPTGRFGRSCEITSIIGGREADTISIRNVSVLLYKTHIGFYSRGNVNHWNVGVKVECKDSDPIFGSPIQLPFDDFSLSMNATASSMTTSLATNSTASIIQITSVTLNCTISLAIKYKPSHNIDVDIDDPFDDNFFDEHNNYLLARLHANARN